MLSTAFRARLPLATWIAGVLVAGSFSFAESTTLPEPRAGEFALDQAFRFATAIEVDPKDQARAQSIVIEDYLSLGVYDRAVAQAARVQGWRQGLVLADIAARFAADGQIDRATELIGGAEAVRQTETGWENPRISAHIALALAQSGKLDRARQRVAQLAQADPRQYAGLVHAAEAIGQVARGDFDGGQMALQAAADATDFEITWWRSRGYLELARRDSLTAEQRLEVLGAARHSLDGVAGWRKIDALTQLANQYFELGEQALARTTLEAADQIVATVGRDVGDRVPLVILLGQAWAKLGDPRRARTHLKDAAAGVGRAMDIEQPGLLAAVAAGYGILGDRDEARRGLHAAFSSAESLANARPRALAVMAICRQHGRAGLDLDRTHSARLDALFEGLSEPW